MPLRPYQIEAVDAIESTLLNGSQRTLAIMPTGVGKTECFVELAGRWQERGRVMLIAHRAELIEQIVERVSRNLGVFPGIEKAELSCHEAAWCKPPVVVASIQTLISGRGDNPRVNRFSPSDFGLLVIDECFPGHTRVCGKRIDGIRCGDFVGTGSVVRVFRRAASQLLRLVFRTGRTLVCTPNHPIFDGVDFVPAATLTVGSVVATIIRYDKVHHLQAADRRWALWASAQAMRKRGMQVGILETNDPQLIQEAWWRNNEVPQDKRHAQTGGSCAGINEVASDGVVAIGTRWKRPRPDDASKAIGVSVGLADGGCCAYSRRAPQGWPANLLQARHRQWRVEGGNRGRRQFAQVPGSPKARCEEGRIFGFDRVESITVHQPGRGDGFESLCPGGIVYNLEVEPNHIYDANGVIVHNCHHSVGASYRRVLDHFGDNTKVLGVTATPDRHDERALGQIFDSVAYEMGVLDAIRAGWLVPIRQKPVTIIGLDFSTCRTTAGDLNGADLERVMMEEKAMLGVAGAAMDFTADRSTIIFTPSVASAERLTEIINRPNYRPDSAVFICAQTIPEYRQERIAGFRNGKYQFLVNVGITIEGFDAPRCSCIIMGRPTKSRSLYEQMLGRGTRPEPGIVDQHHSDEARVAAIAESGKPDLLVVDLVGNAGKHKLVNAFDVLGGDWDDDIAELAMREAVADPEQPWDVQEQLRRAAQKQHELAKAAEARRRAHIHAKAIYQEQRSVDPFDVLDINPWRQKGYERGRPPSENMLNGLRKFRVSEKELEGLTFATARQFISRLIERSKKGYCTWPMARQLAKRALPIDVPYKVASGWMDELAHNHWKVSDDLRKRADQYRTEGE